jgi:stage V sporulation protein G
MQVTNISVKPIDGGERLKGYATIILDHQLAINNIKIIQARKSMCIDFPRDKDMEKLKLEFIAPLNHEIRNHIQSLILKSYRTGVDYFLINKPRRIYRLASTNHMLPSRKR